MKLFLLQLLIDFARWRHDNFLRAARSHLTGVLNLLRWWVANGCCVIFFTLLGGVLKGGNIRRTVVVAAAAAEFFQRFRKRGLRLVLSLSWFAEVVRSRVNQMALTLQHHQWWLLLCFHWWTTWWCGWWLLPQRRGHRRFRSLLLLDHLAHL